MNKKTIVIISIFLSLVLIFIEFFFIRFELFELFPHTGIFLHLTGGILVSQIIFFHFYDEIFNLSNLIVLVFIVGSVSLACISWEIFEWILGYFTKRVFLGNLDNTIFDLGTGVLGGIFGFFIARKLDKFVK